MHVYPAPNPNDIYYLPFTLEHLRISSITNQLP